MLIVKTRIAASPIHGLGLFADESIRKGARVWSFLDGFDLVFSESFIEKLSPAVKDQFLRYCYRDLGTHEYVLCSDDARFFNHSDDPNTRSLAIENEEIVDIAVRDIRAGEELTCDYRTFDLDWERKLGRR